MASLQNDFLDFLHSPRLASAHLVRWRLYIGSYPGSKMWRSIFADKEIDKFPPSALEVIPKCC